MKQIRTYEPRCPQDWYCEEKTTFLLDDEEATHFAEMMEDGKFSELEKEIKFELGVSDRHDRFDGDRYEVYWFYMTKPNRMTLVREWGYSV